IEQARSSRDALYNLSYPGFVYEGIQAACSGISVELVDIKDFDPNVEQNYDRSIESFYHVKLPYVDLLFNYAGQSVGKLMTLKPLIIPFRKVSAAGPSASPFL
nr:hypothetical protein [Tanacetum cinerariifolium]